MVPTLTADPLPLVADEHGTIRVPGTRVTLDLIMDAYLAGASAQQIAEEFDTLELADIHAVIAYYLRHRAEVEAYLARREAEAAEIRVRIEGAMPPRVTREELLRRRAARQGS